MPGPPRRATLQLLVFVAIVLAGSALLFVLNRAILIQESALSAAGNAKLRAALEKLHADPTRLAMTMNADCSQERPMRRLNSRIIEPPEVVVLGMSDADHMSGTFFRDDVRFYNSFISNSFFAYQVEALEELIERGRPQLVLYDVRSGYLLKQGPEPDYDLPANDPTWWYGAPKTWSTPRFSLDQLDSLLSLDQTQRSLQTLWHRARIGQGPVVEQADDGEQYRVVLASQPSEMNRWLADGSRVYKKEHDAILVKRNLDHAIEQTGRRVLNKPRVAMLETYVARVAAEVPVLILYSPPVSPLVLEDPSQEATMRACASRVREIATRHNLDYCDLSRDWERIGCTPEDFYDEIHFSRRCNGRILRELATGCAPRAGGTLAHLLKPSTLDP